MLLSEHSVRRPQKQRFKKNWIIKSSAIICTPQKWSRSLQNYETAIHFLDTFSFMGKDQNAPHLSHSSPPFVARYRCPLSHSFLLFLAHAAMGDAAPIVIPSSSPFSSPPWRVTYRRFREEEEEGKGASERWHSGNNECIFDGCAYQLVECVK